MSRCRICDFSSQSPSMFTTGLVKGWSTPHLKFDRKTHSYVCSDCFESIGQVIREDSEDSDDVDFNAPTMSLWEE